MNTRSATAKDADTPVAGSSMGRRLLKPVVFVVCLLPLLQAIAGVAGNKFVDPVESLLHTSGEWGLRLLLVTLCVTPVQFIFKWPLIGRLRRMLGLFAFFYTTMHLTVWVVLDQGLDIADAVSAIVEKPFITIGMIVWLGLLVLAVTSNRFSVRKLGRRWKSLHSWVYLLVLLAIVHFVWQVKVGELLEPAMYVGTLTLLLVWRFIRMVKR